MSRTDPRWHILVAFGYHQSDVAELAEVRLVWRVVWYKINWLASRWQHVQTWGRCVIHHLIAHGIRVRYFGPWMNNGPAPCRIWHHLRSTAVRRLLRIKRNVPQLLLTWQHMRRAKLPMPRTNLTALLGPESM